MNDIPALESSRLNGGAIIAKIYTDICTHTHTHTAELPKKNFFAVIEKKKVYMSLWSIFDMKTAYVFLCFNISFKKIQFPIDWCVSCCCAINSK